MRSRKGLAGPVRLAPAHLAALGRQLSRGRAADQVALAQRGVELRGSGGQGWSAWVVLQLYIACSQGRSRALGKRCVGADVCGPPTHPP